MENTSSNSIVGWVALAGVILLAIFAAATHVGPSASGLDPSQPIFQLPSGATVGATFTTPHEEVYPWGFGSGLQIGPPSQAPVLKLVGVGTCNLADGLVPGSFAATTTRPFNCKVGSQYNVQAGDEITVDLPSTVYYNVNGNSGAGFGNFLEVNSFASTTQTGSNGTITVNVMNLTGAATSSYPEATTSAEFFIFRI